MRKTALTQLINKYEKEAKKTNSPTIEYLLKMVINDIKEMKLLETEREQIEEAHDAANINWRAGSPTPIKDGYTYYKDTYE